MDINLNGYIVRVCEVNPMGGETVFFLHGWPLSHEIFEYQWRELAARGIRCVGMDFLGYGDSDKPWKGYSYDEQAELAGEVMKYLGLNDVTLLGYSMGGAVAVRLLSRLGAGRVKKLILVGAATPSFVKREGFPYGNTTESVDALIKNVASDKPKAFAEFTDMVFEDDISPEFANWFASIANKSAIWAAQKSLISLRDEDLRHDLEKINIPTAIFHGTHDRVCPFELAEQTHARIKSSFLLPFDFSGHGVFYEERDKLSLAIADFVEGNLVYPTTNTTFSLLAKAPPLDAYLDQHYRFENKPLPFAFDALEPYIDQKTMQLHHDNHLGTYIENLNAALKGYPELQRWTLERLLMQSGRLPQEIRTAVEHNAGGVYNHFFFFDGLSARRSQPSAMLLTAINKYLGSFEALEKSLTTAALSVFGSGYAWLVQNRNNELEILTTKNQDTPLVKGKTPLLNIDVWEHAYYLKHYNKRQDYLKDILNVIDWQAVEQRMHQ